MVVDAGVDSWTVAVPAWAGGFISPYVCSGELAADETVCFVNKARKHGERISICYWMV